MNSLEVITVLIDPSHFSFPHSCMPNGGLQSVPER
jgi:hypothetical protein